MSRPTEPIAKHNTGFWLLFLVSIPAYFLLGYQLQRSQTYEVFLCFGVIILAYLWMHRWSTGMIRPSSIILPAVFLRLLFLFALPRLSDDFYRFIWDGRLLFNGISPFLYTPTELMSQGLSNASHAGLYHYLNSPDYFSVYPPVHQALFAFSVWVFPDSVTGSVIVMRLIIIAAEVANLLILHQLTKMRGHGNKWLFLYAFNPLVILELTANLHFEGIMMMFIMLSMYWLQQQKAFKSGLFIALAVASKLQPLMLLPLWLLRLNTRRLFIFYASTALALLFLFGLFLLDPAFLNSMQSSLTLYVKRFEFNASLYYLLREVGYIWKGYNIIQVAGPYLALAGAFYIFCVTWYAKKRHWNIWRAIFWVWLGYLVLSTTVHPWYIIPVLISGLLAGYHFPVLWSLVVLFTYVNYQEAGYNENLWIVGAEYSLVFLAFILESVFSRNKPQKADI